MLFYLDCQSIVVTQFLVPHLMYDRHVYKLKFTSKNVCRSGTLSLVL